MIRRRVRGRKSSGSLPVPRGDVKLRPVQGRLLLFAMDREKPAWCHLALLAP